MKTIRLLSASIFALGSLTLSVASNAAEESCYFEQGQTSIIVKGVELPVVSVSSTGCSAYLNSEYGISSSDGGPYFFHGNSVQKEDDIEHKGSPIGEVLENEHGFVIKETCGISLWIIREDGSIAQFINKQRLFSVAEANRSNKPGCQVKD